MLFTDDIIRHALTEDIGEGDLTTEAVIPESLKGRGEIVAKEDCVVAGVGVAGGVFLTVDPRSDLEQRISDGETARAGAVILQVTASYRSLLKGERLALNFLGRLCGIATLTRRYADRVGSSKTRILDTRKTVPLLRHLDKYAVRIGGGSNHRFGLYDEILIKNNHISAAGSVDEAIRRVRKKYPQKKITVEVARLDQIEPAISAGAARLLLDNMNDADVAAAVGVITGRTEVEVSGGITIDRAEKLARMHVDFISVGALTHSPRATDLHFRLQPV